MWQLLSLGLGLAVFFAWKKWGRELAISRKQEIALAFLPAFLSLYGLFSTWAFTSPHWTPTGADSDGNYASALALVSGSYGMYEGDRYPLYPYLIWLLSPSAEVVHLVGTGLSMGVTLLLGPVLYSIGRQLQGRTLGFCMALLAYPMPIVLDSGRSFTPYPLVAFLNLGMLSVLLALPQKPSLWPLLGLCAGGAMAADPKQLPLVLGALGLGALFLLFAQAWRHRAGVFGLLLIVPLTHAFAGFLPVSIMSLEEITTRVNLGFVVSEEVMARVEGGYRLGRNLKELLPSLLSLAQGVEAADGQSWLHPRAQAALPLIFPETSKWWLVGIGLLLFRLYQKPHAILVLLLFGGSSLPALQLHYQHRYLMGGTALLPGLVLGGLPAPVVAGITLGARIFGPYFLSPSYLERQDRQTDAWVGVEGPLWHDFFEWAEGTIKPEGRVFDFSESRPWPLLGAFAPYQRCNRSDPGCRSSLGRWENEAYAVLWANEALSGQLAGQVREEAGVMPERVGECWEKLHQQAPQTAVYHRVCRK